MDIQHIKSKITEGGGVEKGRGWKRINIEELKKYLSGNKYKAVKEQLSFSKWHAYYWIWDDDFDKWFNDVVKLIQEQQEAPTDSPIEASEDVEGDKVDKKYDSLLNKDGKYISLKKLAVFCGGNETKLYKNIITCGTYNESAGTLYPRKDDIMKIKGYIKHKLDKHEEHKENIREEGRKEATEQKDKEIEDIQKEHIKQIQAEREDKNNKVADMKNKKENEINDLQQQINNNNIIKTSNNSPSIKNFIKDAYINGDYKLGADELRKRYTSGKYKQILKDTNIDNVINDVMLYSTLETQKKKQKLAQLAQIGAFSPEAMANMDPNTQQEINDAIVAQSRITNAQKRLRYKLPINKPKARAAMLNQHINPMVFRGAYSTGNY